MLSLASFQYYRFDVKLAGSYTKKQIALSGCYALLAHKYYKFA